MLVFFRCTFLYLSLQHIATNSSYPRHGFAYFVGRDRALRPALVFRALDPNGMEVFERVVGYQNGVT